MSFPVKFKLIIAFSILWLFIGCSDFSDHDSKSFEPSEFIDSINQAQLPCEVVKNETHPKLLKPLAGKSPVAVYMGENFSFALYNSKNLNIAELDDQNRTLEFAQNNNLTLCGTGSNGAPYIKALEDLKPGMSFDQLGLFIYPMGFCMLIAIFVSCERFYSLRSGLTFPAKVAKALRSGEFPNKKWNQRSAAERIVWVATRENPSIETLRSYSRLEIAAMERGFFLLEVVVSAAPLLGLLGTVTGLVQVFSQIPSGGGAGDTTVFSEGIALALLTTIVGLAIAIPTLISHSYLVRLVEKRASSIDWLTERLVDAIYPSK
jgi:biopolymer transport protein ExbB